MVILILFFLYIVNAGGLLNSGNSVSPSNSVSDKLKMFNKSKPSLLVKSASEKVINYSSNPRKSAQQVIPKFEPINFEGRKSVKDLINMNERKLSKEIVFDENEKNNKDNLDTNAIPFKLRHTVSENFSKNMSNIKDFLSNFNSNEAKDEELKKLGIVDESGMII